jgi:protein deglycase
MPGAERLRDSATLKELLAAQLEKGKLTTAICASPAVVLETQGLLKGKKATAHPAFTDKLSDTRCGPKISIPLSRDVPGNPEREV